MLAWMTNRRQAPPTSIALLLLVAFPLTCVAWPTRAQMPDVRAAFEEGNARYAERDYAEAVLAYERAEAAGYVSAALYHNLANAHVHLGQLGQAVCFYEKARRLAPDDPRVRHNLETVRGRLDDPLVAAPPAPGLVAAARHWPAGWSLGLGLALTWLGVAALTAHAWPRPAEDDAPHFGGWLKATGGLLLVAGLLFAALGWAASYAEALDRRTVVVASDAALRPAPAADGTPVTVLPEGSVLRLRRRRARWAEVALPDGTTGWLDATAVADV